MLTVDHGSSNDNLRYHRIRHTAVSKEGMQQEDLEMESENNTAR